MSHHARLPPHLHPKFCARSAMDPHYTTNDNVSDDNPFLWRATSNEGPCSLSVVLPQVKMQERCNSRLIELGLKRLWGRSLFFIGDSLMLQQWLSTLLLVAPQLARQGAALACPDLSRVYSNHTASWGGIRMIDCAHSIDWPKRGVRICFAHNTMDKTQVADLLRHLVLHRDVSKDDVVLVNAGLWARTPQSLFKSLLQLRDEVQYQAKLGVAPSVYLRDTSPQHFPRKWLWGSGPAGAWRGVNSSTLEKAQCTPGDGYSGSFDRNSVAKTVLYPSKWWALKRLRIWEQSVGDWSHHLGQTMNRQGVAVLDCTHYCLPSTTMSSWTLTLFEQLTSEPQMHSC